MGELLETGYTIDFGGKTEMSTDELLEELGISYNTLAGRIRSCGFPRPTQRGQRGRVAVYDVQEVKEWLKQRGVTYRN